MATPRDTLETAVNRALSERIERARRTFTETLAEIGAPLPVGDAGVAATAGDAGLRPITFFCDATRQPGSQREILNALLEAASGLLSRSILFILRADTLTAWAVRSGVGQAGDAEARGAHMTLPARGDHLPARAVAAAATAVAGSEGPGFVITEGLGGTVPAHAIAVPILVRGRIVALLYGDSGAGRGALAEPALAVLGRLAGLVLESLAAGRRTRTAPARETATAGRMRVEVGAATNSATRVSGSAGSIPSGPVLPAAGGDLWDDAPQADPPGTGLATLAPPEDAEMQALLGDLDGMRHGAGDGGLSPEEQRQHADARRFASLLISEILLYNEEAVIQGRRHRDLGRRLSKEIAKSRQAYASRLPANLRAAARYFEEELVRVLAEGDASAIGA